MLAILTLAAAAAAANDPPPRIIVAGTGIVATPPDRATIDYTVRGEGSTPEAALRALVERRRTIEAALAGFAPPVALHASKVSVREVRDPRCKPDDDDAPRLAGGTCAVVGAVAEIASTLATSAVAQAGTVVGQLARAGAINPRVEDFGLSHPRDAERGAIAAALADARRKAEAVAAGTGARLGRLLSVSTDPDRDDAGDVVVTGSRLVSPAIVAPPIPIEVAPAPVETRARVAVTYAISE